jgi:hypothetical protein
VYQEENPVRITVYQARNRTLVLLSQWIIRLARSLDELMHRRYDSAPQRMEGIVRRNEAQVIGRNRHWQFCPVALQGQTFLLRESQNGLEALHCPYPVRHLPVPVVPLLGTHAGIIFTPELPACIFARGYRSMVKRERKNYRGWKSLGVRGGKIIRIPARRLLVFLLKKIKTGWRFFLRFRNFDLLLHGDGPYC